LSDTFPCAIDARVQYLIVDLILGSEMKKTTKILIGVLLVLSVSWFLSSKVGQRTFVNITSVHETKTIGQERAIKGIYLNSRSISVENTVQIIRKITEHGFNAVVINVKNVAGEITYASKVPLAKQLGAVTGRLDITTIVEKFHESGIYVIARLTCFRDPVLAAFCCSGGNWANPDDSTAKQYNINIAKEVSTLGFDELQLDYIRYSDGPGKIGGNYSHRSKVIAGFIEQLRSQISPHVKLSADVYGRTLWDWNSKDIDPIGQNLRYIQDHVDYLSPMIYPSHYRDPSLVYDPYKLVDLALKAGSSRLDVGVRPFIQGFDRSLPSNMSLVEYIQEELQALEDNDQRGFLVWNPRSNYDSLWEAIETY